MLDSNTYGLTWANTGRGRRELQNRKWNARRRGKRAVESQARQKPKPGNWRTWCPLLHRRLKTKTSLQTDREYTDLTVEQWKCCGGDTRLPWRRSTRSLLLSCSRMRDILSRAIGQEGDSGQQVAAQPAAPPETVAPAVPTQQNAIVGPNVNVIVYLGGR